MLKNNSSQIFILTAISAKTRTDSSSCVLQRCISCLLRNLADLGRAAKYNTRPWICFNKAEMTEASLTAPRNLHKSPVYLFSHLFKGLQFLAFCTSDSFLAPFNNLLKAGSNFSINSFINALNVGPFSILNCAAEFFFLFVFLSPFSGK